MRALAFLAVLLLALAPVVAIVPNDPGFRGCVILLPEGQFNDADCDRTPDVVDNCALTENPVQSDVDANGIGDACDLVIDELRLEPEVLQQGRSLLVTASIFNNRPYPMRNLVAKAELPRLGTIVSQPLPIIAPGQRISTEILLRVPDCAPPLTTDLVVYVEYPFAPNQKEVFTHAARVPVQETGACPLTLGEELTVVDIIELQDVLPDKPAIYPFTIRNNWPESKAYVLSVQGMESWGTATIEPGSVIVVPPGGAREGAVIVAGYGGQTGLKSFTLSVHARDDAKQVLLRADLKQLIAPSQPRDQLFIGVFIFLGVLILIAVALVLIGKGGKKKLHDRIEEIEREEEKPAHAPAHKGKKRAA